MGKKLNIKDITNTEWHYIHSRSRSPFFVFLLFNGLARHNSKDIKFPYEIKKFVYIDGTNLSSLKDWKKFGNEVIKEMKKDKSFFLKLINKSYYFDKQLVEFIKKISALNFKKLSNQALIDNLKRYQILSFRSAASVFLVAPLTLEKYLEENIIEAISKKTPAEKDEFIRAISLPVKESSTQSAEHNLLRLAVKRKQGVNIGRQIAKHVNDFGWLKNVDFFGNFYSAADIEKEIDKLAKVLPEEKIKKNLVSRRAHLKDIKRIKSVFKKDKHVLGLINTLQEAIYFRSWRSERFYRNAQYLEEFFKEISRRIGCTYKNLFFLTPLEIINILRKNALADKKLWQERESGYLLFVSDKKCFIESGKFLALAKKKLNFLKYKKIKNNIIKGQTAYPGAVKGIARLVWNKKDFNLIRQGEILVTPSTTPDYVPVLKKVKAIIADEGGILSHASVISREMKIPCIIGTKNATRIIKSGNLLEVDAGKGIVKILNKK